MDQKGIIFDLDGVLVSTDQYHYQAWKSIADEIGVRFDEHINDRLRGVSRMESLEIILENYSGPVLTQGEKIALAERKNDRYRQLLCEMSPSSVSQSVRHTLETLRKKGYRLAVGSSSKNAKTILERVSLTQAFDAFSDGTNITRSKPDPEVFLKAAQFLHLEPFQCAVVEDARSGIDAAVRAGMLPIGIGDAAGYAQSTVSIRQLPELLNIF